MKKIYFISITILILITSCNKEPANKKTILIFTNYYGANKKYDSLLYTQLTAINLSIDIKLILTFGKQHEIITSSDISIFDVKKLKNENIENVCNNNLKFDLNTKRLFVLAKRKKVDILILATPKATNNNNKFNINYQVIHLDNNCVTLKCTNKYILSLKSANIDYTAVRKIANELSKIIKSSE